MRDEPGTELQSALPRGKSDVGAWCGVCISVSGTRSRRAASQKGFLRSLASGVYLLTLGSAFPLPLKLYWEMDSLARRV